MAEGIEVDGGGGFDVEMFLETGLAEQFVSTLEKITDQNLGDKEPHPFVEWFFYSHPSIKNRVNAVKIFAKANNISPTVSDEGSLSLQSN